MNECEYAPWVMQGVSEVEYWKANYTRARTELSTSNEIIKVLEESNAFYADPGHWDYYDSIKEGSDIPENPSTPWNAVFQPDEDDSELMDGYGLVSGHAYVNGKRAREAQAKVAKLREEK